ncbi:hypothetical protein ACEPAF_5945 [Sanghuangporus sanghuang]
MHNLRVLTTSLAISSAFSSVFFAQDQDSLQALLSGGNQWNVDSENHDAPLQPKHPIPPNRGNGFDPWNLSSLTNTIYHDTYHPLFEIDEYMEHLAALYPTNVSVSELGHSSEGREMYAMRISGGATVDGNGQRIVKKGFLIVLCLCFQWVASASALYLAHALLANSSEPNSISHLLDSFDFYVLPVPNPDGYVFTWESDRLWYKNRMSLGPNEACRGLDMNRNWGYHWSPSDRSLIEEEEDLNLDLTDFDDEDIGAVKKKKGKKGKKKKPKKPKKNRPAPADPCSHWFPGHRPFEAPEVNNIANYIMQLPNLHVFIDLRSYGQMLSWPYSYACDTLPADAEDLYEAALGAAYAMRKKHGTVYTTGSLCSALYPAPGNILDWMYASAGIKYSYAVHLRDTGTYGYSLPQEWIRPVGEETAALVEYIVKFILSPAK